LWGYVTEYDENKESSIDNDDIDNVDIHNDNTDNNDFDNNDVDNDCIDTDDFDNDDIDNKDNLTWCCQASFTLSLLSASNSTHKDM
jgi:hypothetical protein